MVPVSFDIVQPGQSLIDGEAGTHRHKARTMQIPIHKIEEAALEIMRRAAIEIPDDYRQGILELRKTETGKLPRFVIHAMVENWEAADQDRRPMCADTGLPRYYVKVGNNASVESGFVAVERALRHATAEGTVSIPLRPNRVHPLWRTDHNNNVGLNAPEVEWSFEPDADWIDITTVHKGGLFGTDYRMLFPGDGIDGIKRFVLDTLIAFGKRGLACQPAIVGIGLGGSKDTCMQLGKQAACLRTVGDRNPDPRVAELELELMKLGNAIGMGAMGFVGSGMVVDCHIECGYTHTGGMPISLHTFCLSSRRATARIHADGRIEYRTDPQWFTPICAGRRSNGKQDDDIKVFHLDLPARTEDIARLELGSAVPERPGLHGARGRLQEGAGRRAGAAGGPARAQQRELPLLAGRRAGRAGRLQGRRRHGHGLVPLFQVDSALAGGNRLPHPDRQGRHAGGRLQAGAGAWRRDLPDHGGLRHWRAAGARHQARARGALAGRAGHRAGDVAVRCRELWPLHRGKRSEGNSLFAQHAETINAGIERLYAGLKPPALHRYGETDDRKDEVM